MHNVPKSLRLHIGIIGRTNTGKSSLLNLIAGQQTAITSAVPGTTTDVVEKSMELLPVGPVVLLDTAGLDDDTELSSLRLEKTMGIWARSDIILIVTKSYIWTIYEEDCLREARKRRVPFIIMVNEFESSSTGMGFPDHINTLKPLTLRLSAIDVKNRDKYVNELKSLILKICPADFLAPPPLLGDLLKPGGPVVMVVPIDLEAPKGRLILPQVQAIREALDYNYACIIVKETGYSSLLDGLKDPPCIVICDSQVVDRVVKETPAGVLCTTFSILFARYKGDLIEEAKGLAFLQYLNAGDRVLIAEACSHHPLGDDIGRVKIPRWLQNYCSSDILIDTCSKWDFPSNLTPYKMIIHCGGCMLNRREILSRIDAAKKAKVSFTNYGLCISVLKNVQDTTLKPFPTALHAYKTALMETATLK